MVQSWLELVQNAPIHKFQTPPNAVDCFDIVKACKGVFLLCFMTYCRMTI